MVFVLSYSFCLLILLLQAQPFSSIVQSYKIVSLGSSLSALDCNTAWKSPSGEFAFGFQHIGNDGFLLATWFDKMQEKTIVWSANRDKPVQRGSRIKLSEDGRLVLTDPKWLKIWDTDTVDRRVANAAMLDTGNFVMARKDSVTLWGSFGELMIGLSQS